VTLFCRPTKFRGAVAIELLAAVPLLLTMVAATVIYGAWLTEYNRLVYLVDDAARYLSAFEYSTDPSSNFNDARREMFERLGCLQPSGTGNTLTGTSSAVPSYSCTISSTYCDPSGCLRSLTPSALPVIYISISEYPFDAARYLPDWIRPLQRLGTLPTVSSVKPLGIVR